MENYSVIFLKCKGLAGSAAVINTLLLWLWSFLLWHKWGREVGGSNQALDEGCRVWILFSSPSRHLFLFLIYLSGASEKMQTVCLVYQSTICLCFNNYTVSRKITLQSITKFCLQTALLCSSMQNLLRLVGMAPYHSDAPHCNRGINNFRGQTCNTFSVCFKCEIPDNWSWLQRTFYSLRAKFHIVFQKHQVPWQQKSWQKMTETNRGEGIA